MRGNKEQAWLTLLALTESNFTCQQPHRARRVTSFVYPPVLSSCTLDREQCPASPSSLACRQPVRGSMAVLRAMVHCTAASSSIVHCGAASCHTSCFMLTVMLHAHRTCAPPYCSQHNGRRCSAEKHVFIVEKRVAVVSGMIRTMLSSSTLMPTSSCENAASRTRS